jgi:ribosomal protein S27AE
MSVQRHLVLKTVAEVIGFVGGAIFVLSMGDGFRIWRIPFPWSAAVPIVVGIGVAFWVFKFIPARCPKCAGSAYAKGMEPVRYVCGGCGHIQWTD